MYNKIRHIDNIEQTFRKFVVMVMTGRITLNCPILRFRRPILPRA